MKTEDLEIEPSEVMSDAQLFLMSQNGGVHPLHPGLRINLRSHYPRLYPRLRAQFGIPELYGLCGLVKAGTLSGDLTGLALDLTGVTGDLDTEAFVFGEPVAQIAESLDRLKSVLRAAGAAKGLSILDAAGDLFGCDCPRDVMLTLGIRAARQLLQRRSDQLAWVRSEVCRLESGSMASQLLVRAGGQR